MCSELSVQPLEATVAGRVRRRGQTAPTSVSAAQKIKTGCSFFRLLDPQPMVETLGEPSRSSRASALCPVARLPSREPLVRCARHASLDGCRWTRRAREVGAARRGRGGLEAFALFQALPGVALRPDGLGWGGTSEEKPHDDQDKGGHTQQPSDEKFPHGGSP